MEHPAETMISSEQSRPAPRTRILIAVIVALLAASLAYLQFLRANHHHLDFGEVWFASHSMIRGVNPYPLVGENLQFDWMWGLIYPLTASVLVLPLGFLPELPASLLFVGISAFAFVYLLSKEGFHRLWILGSSAFVISCMAGQWSPLFCAAILYPPLAFVAAAKPTLGLTVLITRREAIVPAAIGGAILLAASLIAIPHWPVDWLHALRSVETTPPVTWFGGVILLLAVIRWRSWEARLLLGMSLVPLTAGWYEVLPLLLIAQTKRECQIFSLISSAGYLMQAFFVRGDGTVSVEVTKNLLIVSAYLPALILVLFGDRKQVAALEAKRWIVMRETL